MRNQNKKNHRITIIFKLQQPDKQNNQSGFTIIESLVAIIVVAILMTAISPVIVLSTATRLQSRRVELATQAAKAYIDGITAGNIQAPTGTVPKGQSLNTFAVPKQSDLKDLYCFDVDGGKCGENIQGKLSNKDLRVQGFRTDGDIAQGFALGIRVYRNDVLPSDGTLRASTGGEKATQKTYGALINKTAPLVETTTEIASDKSFSNFCQRIPTDTTSSTCK
jgi:prepilin-type N-terminal cleavage/methylation domain-containing protein